MIIECIYQSIYALYLITGYAIVMKIGVTAP
jgi:hypothetical protein